MGLAWTSMGGATLYVEAAKVNEGADKGHLKTTGAQSYYELRALSLCCTMYTAASKCSQGERGRGQGAPQDHGCVAHLFLCFCTRARLSYPLRRSCITLRTGIWWAGV